MDSVQEGLLYGELPSHNERVFLYASLVLEALKR
jgi:hypothetical protein